MKEEAAGEPNVDGGGANPQAPSQSSTAFDRLAAQEAFSSYD